MDPLGRFNQITNHLSKRSRIGNICRGQQPITIGTNELFIRIKRDCHCIAYIQYVQTYRRQPL